MKIIAITGTKGKTTVTRAISHIIYAGGRDVLRVDTDGHYINEKQKSTLDDSKRIYSLVPTVCPGRYLCHIQKKYPHFTAVLEEAIGCSNGSGIGYGLHQVGIFTNVLEDHLGVSKRLKTRRDIALAKNFIFSKIDLDGTAVFNADDHYVCEQLKAIPQMRKVRLLPVGIHFSHFEIEEHLRSGGSAITIEHDHVVVKSKDSKQIIISTKEIPWTFEGAFTPSLYNLMFIIGGVYAHNNGIFTKDNYLALKRYKMDHYGGRLTLLHNSRGVRILVDFAHERFSLSEVARLGKVLSAGSTIGIVRLAPDRTDKMIFETGQYIANRFNNLIVYDKIDGDIKKEYRGRKSTFSRKIGEVSQIFHDGILSKKKNGLCERIIREEDAIRRAAQLANSGDVVIAICGDDHKRTLSLIKKHFDAQFS